LDTSRTVALWPFVPYLVAVLAVVVVMLGLSYILGQRHRERATGEPYESGIVSTGSARMRFDAKFYLMAMFFVIFDLEAAFIYLWAVAVKELSWTGYVEIALFIAILFVALVYLWRVGALEWGTERHGISRTAPMRTRGGSAVTKAESWKS
jgi:NADH-quinone oxidoreductase subunit A